MHVRKTINGIKLKMQSMLGQNKGVGTKLVYVEVYLYFHACTVKSPQYLFPPALQYSTL